MATVWIEKQSYKRNTYYIVRWKSKGNKPGSKSFRDKAAAEIYKGNKRIELRSAEKPDERVYLEYAIKNYIEDAKTYKSKRTIQIDEYGLSRFIEYTQNPKIHDINIETVKAFKLWLLKNAKHHKGIGFHPNTVRIYLRVVKAFFNYLRISPNPVNGVQMPTEVEVARVIKKEELQKLMSFLKRNIREAVELDLHTGLRLSELLSIQIEHIHDHDDYYAIEIKSYANFKTKTRKSRLVPVAKKLIDPIKGERKEGLLFPDLTPNKIQWALRFAREKLGLGRIRMHDLRHTWATEYAKISKDYFGLMGLGGWQNPASAKRYQHLTLDRSRSNLKLNFGTFSEDSTEKKHSKS